MGKLEIKLSVTDGEKTIEFPWTMLQEDYKTFMTAQRHYSELEAAILRVVESRIRCVFYDLYQKYLTH